MKKIIKTGIYLLFAYLLILNISYATETAVPAVEDPPATPAIKDLPAAPTIKDVAEKKKAEADVLKALLTQQFLIKFRLRLRRIGFY